MLQDTNFKSTKFWMTVYILTLSFVLVLLEYLPAKDWFAWATVGSIGYLTANVVQKATQK